MNASLSPDLCFPFLTGDPVDMAVALSGGPDSMALGFLLAQAVEALPSVIKPTIHLLTVNHGLRAEAPQEAAQVGRWVADWPHVRHVILNRDLKGLGKTRILEGARDDRYRLLAEYCRANGIGKLFVAHHGDDQAETFLFRLAKGSGLDGLSCMQAVRPYDDQLSIIRPFLPVNKTEILAYCADHNVPYVEDPTNDDKRFVRPRLRQSARILAEEGLSAKRLTVTAQRLARAQEALELYAARTFEKLQQDKSGEGVALDYDGWCHAPEETRLRVVQKAMAELIPDDSGYGPRLERLETLVARFYAEADFKSATLGGFLFSVDRKNNLLRIAQEKSA